MKPKDYWIKRAEDSILYAEGNADEFYKRIKVIYDGTMKAVQDEIDEYYIRYGFSYLESLKPLSVKEVIKLRNVAVNRLKQARTGMWQEKYTHDVEVLTKRLRISRLEALKFNINHNMQELYEAEYAAYQQALPQQYLDSYYHSTYTLQDGIGVGYSFSPPQDTFLKTIVNYKFMESNFSETIWGRKRKNLLKLEQILTQGMIQGKNPRDIANDLRLSTGGSGAKYSDCERLARTEFNLIANKATEDVYKDSKLVEKYEYVATLDNRTSSICASMDGSKIPLKDAKVGINYPPLHPFAVPLRSLILAITNYLNVLLKTVVEDITM